jgi:hypothetical protein
MSRLESEGCLDDDWDVDIPTMLVELQSIVSVDTEILRPLQVEELRAGQAPDDWCQSAVEKGSLYGHKVGKDADGLVMGVVRHRGGADVHQILVPASLRQKLL